MISPGIISACVELFEDAIDAAAGSTKLDTLNLPATEPAAISIDSVLVSAILPDVAVITAVPAATAVAKPELLIVAFDVSDDVHVTVEVKSLVVLSEYVPTAVNCFVSPTIMVGFVGVTVIDISETPALFIDNVLVPAVLPDVAVIVTLPTANADANPELLTATFEVSDDDHITDEVKSLVVLSEYVPAAENCCVAPILMVGFVGVTVIDTSEAPMLFVTELAGPSLSPLQFKRKNERTRIKAVRIMYLFLMMHPLNVKVIIHR